MQRASGIPCALFLMGRELLANLGRIASREREGVFAVIASEAKQSILASLRDGLLRGACHRARIRATRWLAMTVGLFEIQIHFNSFARQRTRCRAGAAHATGLRISSH